ncbi:MAG: formate dehydrogenase accessory sulfurtransferase FdhD [Planctomycetes bacterium]|nr:formate dehydrogenase accessory sulfurtransferase FdhD [Planctomycetota bacterium]
MDVPDPIRSTTATGPTDTASAGFVERTLDDGSGDRLVREEPLSIRAGHAEVLTMRTPGRDTDLAVGFLLGEGVIDHVDDVLDVRLVPGDHQALRADLAQVALRRPDRARIQGRLTRTHEVRPSCGICGLADADALLEDLPPLLPGTPQLARDAIATLARRMAERQELFDATGGCHAAALFGADGELWSIAEDVGRHNALDKAIGAAARAGRELAHGVAMLSGRAGYDLVLKCMRVRIGVVMSVSAPSALAFDLCRAAGATLIGFVRGERAKIYWSAGRVTSAEGPHP